MSDKALKQSVKAFNELSRQYSDASIWMHEAIARHVGLSGTDHKYVGLLIQKGEMTAGEFSRLTGLIRGGLAGVDPALYDGYGVANKVRNTTWLRVHVTGNR